MARVKNHQSLSEIFSDIASGVTGVFVFIILVIFPLYTHDKYFDILGARYLFFKVWGIMLCAILAFLGILYLFIDAQNRASSPTALRRFVDSFKIHNLKKKIIPTDVFFLIMIISMTISTIGTQFKEEAFFGNAGRYQGLECWIIYFITYIAISRTFRFRTYYLDYAILAGVFASIWGVLDFFQLDPFGFFIGVGTTQRAMFASSIGNLNTYTNYTLIIFALASTLFVVEKNYIKSVFYLVASIIACCGTIFGFSDNAVLGFAGFYLFLPFFVFKNRKYFLRYLITIDVLFISMFLFWFATKFPHNSIQGSFFLDLIRVPYMIYLFIPFTLLIALICFLFVKLTSNHNLDSPLPKQFLIVYVVIITLSFAVITYILLDMNVFKQRVDLWKTIPSSHQLVFNDNWGTHRGHNWRIAFTNFTQNFSWFQRLFGYGPDTYLIVSERTFYEEMVTKYNEVYDSAHNEYINYLICEGLIGLVAYLGIFISGLKIGFKYLKNNIYILAAGMAVITYLVQAIVNIAIPITTPVFFALLYICVAEHFNISKVNGELIK